MSGSLPEHPRLREIAIEVEKTRGAAALHDSDCNLVWVSTELKKLIGEHDEDKLGYGRHAFEAYLSPTWGDRVTNESKMHMFQHLPHVIARTPGGKERVKELLLNALRTYPECIPGYDEGMEFSEEALEQLVDSMEPIGEMPLLATMEMEFLQGDLPAMPVTEIEIGLNDYDGSTIGALSIYHPGQPASVLAMLARGDEQMYSRMTKLIEPGRHRAAILFADLQGSAALSRRLPSAIYFQLVRAMTTATDQVIIDRKGIVGKHAGDGATAFFLADEVNECARIQTAARDGQVLASKPLLEHLDPEDSRELRINPDMMLYQSLGDIPGAPEKAVKDAGGLPVTTL